MARQRADLQLVTRWMNGHPVVAVSGEIDISTAPAVEAYLLDTVGTTPGNGGPGGDLTVDLGAVTFMDVRGLAALLQADDFARQAGHRLRLADLTAPVARLLAITHLDLHFALYLTTKAATKHRVAEPDHHGSG